MTAEIDQKVFDKLITHIELRYGLYPLTHQGVVDALANIVGLNPLIVRNKTTDITLDALAGTMLYFNSTEYQQHQTMMLLHDMIHSHDDDQATVAANLMVIIVNIQKDKKELEQPLSLGAPYLSASIQTYAELELQTKYPWSYESKELLKQLSSDNDVLDYYEKLNFVGFGFEGKGVYDIFKEILEGRASASGIAIFLIGLLIASRKHQVIVAKNSLEKEEKRRTPAMRN